MEERGSGGWRQEVAWGLGASRSEADGQGCRFDKTSRGQRWPHHREAGGTPPVGAQQMLEEG